MDSNSFASAIAARFPLFFCKLLLQILAEEVFQSGGVFLLTAALDTDSDHFASPDTEAHDGHQF